MLCWSYNTWTSSSRHEGSSMLHSSCVLRSHLDSSTEGCVVSCWFSGQCGEHNKLIIYIIVCLVGECFPQRLQGIGGNPLPMLHNCLRPPLPPIKRPYLSVFYCIVYGFGQCSYHRVPYTLIYTIYHTPSIFIFGLFQLRFMKWKLLKYSIKIMVDHVERKGAMSCQIQLQSVRWQH